jgi:hypothetical protein
MELKGGIRGGGASSEATTRPVRRRRGEVTRVAGRGFRGERWRLRVEDLVGEVGRGSKLQGYRLRVEGSGFRVQG